MPFSLPEAVADRITASDGGTITLEIVGGSGSASESLTSSELSAITSHTDTSLTLDFAEALESGFEIDVEEDHTEIDQVEVHLDLEQLTGYLTTSDLDDPMENAEPGDTLSISQTIINY